MKGFFRILTIVFLCSVNVCFVSAQDPPCTEPVAIGFCIKFTKRWAWKNGKCRQFYYSGCGGNDNNFDSYRKCIAQCEHMLQTSQILLNILKALKERRHLKRQKLVSHKLGSSINEHIATALIPRRRNLGSRRTMRSYKNPFDIFLPLARTDPIKVDDHPKPPGHSKKKKKSLSSRTNKAMKTKHTTVTTADKDKHKPIFVVRTLPDNLSPDVLLLLNKYLMHKKKIPTKEMKTSYFPDLKSVLDRLKLEAKERNGKSSKGQKRVKQNFNKIFEPEKLRSFEIGKVLPLQWVKNLDSFDKKYYIQKDKGILDIGAEDDEIYFVDIEEKPHSNMYPADVQVHEHPVILQVENFKSNEETDASMSHLKLEPLRMIIHKGRALKRPIEQKRVLNFNPKSLLTNLNSQQMNMYKKKELR